MCGRTTPKRSWDLLERVADPNELDDLGWTPLQTAVLSGDIKSVRVLIRSGANPAARSGDGRTPLELAEERGHREVSYALRVAIVSSQDEEYSELSTLDRIPRCSLPLWNRVNYLPGSGHGGKAKR